MPGRSTTGPSSGWRSVAWPVDLVQHGVRLGADHVHVVAQPGQLAGEMPDVDALVG